MLANLGTSSAFCDPYRAIGHYGTFSGREKSRGRTEVLAILAFETAFHQTEDTRRRYQEFPRNLWAD